MQSGEEDLRRRLAIAERELDQQRTLVRLQGREMAQIRRELRALGVQVPELRPGGARTPLSPQALRAVQLRRCDDMRRRKPVGAGKGCVSPDGRTRVLDWTPGDTGEPAASSEVA